jgi:hypothetical protein
LVPRTFRAFSAFARSMTIEVLSGLDIFRAIRRYLSRRLGGRPLGLLETTRASLTSVPSRGTIERRLRRFLRGAQMGRCKVVSPE